ncbi:hypothetical protein [Agrobacterium vitis]|uniref:hypothetical protein n=1 Tax=Agrobacterium vitis TaxID=373 RepID=UPI001571B3FD|nr:hypothetical protein [Agrobacterium vitis]NSZ19470.1 hypothetical protein [Agrobacterium vitis]QZO06858.1 hypothetical protein K4831_21905 [Agrobacterium vitis]UJL91519.1 hypothetical protein AVF2S5_26425 [Agrobacterium vitis]
MNATQDKDFKLAVVRKLIQAVEQIDPAKLKPAGEGHHQNQSALIEHVLVELEHVFVGLETFEGLKGIAARLKLDRLSADSDLRDAVKEFEPFATFKGKAATGNTFEGIVPQIRAEHDEIVQSGLVSGMEVPVGDLELQDDTVAEISRWKWTLLFVLYALEFAILYGLEASIWNLIRVLGGDKFTDPKRIATEIAAAIMVAFTLPDFHRLLTHVLARAKLAPVFTGDVNIITEHGEMITTGFLGGLSIDAGVQLATKLAGDDASVIKYWMFLGYFAAFLSAGFINATGQVALGRKLVAGPSGEPFPDNAKQALVVFGKHFIDTDILLHERLFHFVNWFLYNFYGAGFGQGELALAGSLWLFVVLFKVSFFWSEKMRQWRGQ